MIGRRASAVLVFALLSAWLLSTAGCSRHDYMGVDLSRYVPREYLPGVEEALVLAGENGPEILKALTEVDRGDREAMSFLIAELPPVDLASVTTSLLYTTVTGTRETMERFPWGRDIPRDIYLHYVLPPRVSQEPLESCRSYLLEQLGPRIEGMTSMEDAALEVNRWCGERVGFKPTQRRDQGVSATLTSGYGRCEEMMIVHISALRSVCIPARQAWTPYWATCDNNHAWTEVWIDGKWHYTGACEPRDRLDDAWFNDRVRTAPLVLSAVMGNAAAGEDVYREKDRYSIVNSTANYARVGTLAVHVGSKGVPVPDTDATISVWNFGALRSIAKLTTDAEGDAHIALGAGTYFVSSGGPEAYDWKTVLVAPPARTAVTLDLDGAPPFEAAFWMKGEESESE
jgi:hypothetical protein